MNKLHYTLICLFLSICFCIPLSSQTPSAGFATWKDNKKAAYSIIHDDYSNYVPGIFLRADPLATARGIKLAFGAVTSACGPQEWADAKTMISHGHECVNHSHNHRCGGTAGQCTGLSTYGPADFATELDLSHQLIKTNVGVTPRFFIHPYDAPSEEILNHLKVNLGYLGSRAGNQLAVNTSNFTDFMRLNYYVYDGTPTALAGLNTAIDAAISSGGYAVREFHGIDDGSWAAMTLANYTSHLNFVKTKMDDGSLWSATPTEAITYKMQRDAFQPVVTYNSALSTINLTFNKLQNIDPSVLTTPVTVNVNLNGLTGNYSVVQDNKTIIATRASNVISFNIYPHQGAVTLKCTDCSLASPTNVDHFKTTSQPNAVLLTWENPTKAFDEVMIVAKAKNDFKTSPVGSNYVADANFTGIGTAFEGGKVVYKGIGTGVTVTNLTEDIKYYFKIFTRSGNSWSKGVEKEETPKGVAPPVCGPDGKISREYWNNISALTKPSILYLIYNSRYPKNPTIKDFLTEFRSAKMGNNYGERVTGYIVPKETGSYTFYVTGADNVDLYLSSSDESKDKKRICRINGATTERQFDKYASQKSVTIKLKEGKYYYFELLHVNTTSDDHFGVYWKTPSNPTITMIDKSFFSSIICKKDKSDDAKVANYFAFSGSLNGDKGILNWVSKSANETDYYVLEKADEQLGDFKQLDIINVDAKNASLQSFSYIDLNLNDGDNYYRIKTVYQNSVSASGRNPEQYSDIVKIRYDKPQLYDVFPNPTTEYFSIDLSPANGKAVDISIVSLLGKVVKQERIETPSVSHRFELGELKSGQYFVRIQPQGSRLVVKKLVVIH